MLTGAAGAFGTVVQVFDIKREPDIKSRTARVRGVQRLGDWALQVAML